MPSPATLNDGRQLRRILSKRGPALAVFERPGSEACLEIDTVIDEVSREFAGRVPIVRVSDIGRRHTARRYRVFEVPTVVFYSDGREVARIEGTVGPATLRAHLEFLLRQRPGDRGGEGPS